MEPHVAIGDWKERRPAFTSLEEYYCHAHRMCEANYREQLDHFRKLRFETVDPMTFWWEYVWCVYASGFKAAIIGKLFRNLQDALGTWRTLSQFDHWTAVSLLFGNFRKYAACKETADILDSYETDELLDDWWKQFKDDYLHDLAAMRKLPYIGPITCYHLARNLGMDEVKPDLHLVRLADHFEWPDPETMCAYLSGLYDERIGVVDLILWYAASTWGTLEIARG